MNLKSEQQLIRLSNPRPYIGDGLTLGGKASPPKHRRMIGVNELTRTVCFIDNDGNVGTCGIEGLDDEQIIEQMGDLCIDCKKCSFYLKFKGKEKEEFSYTAWTGELNRA